MSFLIIQKYLVTPDVSRVVSILFPVTSFHLHQSDPLLTSTNAGNSQHVRQKDLEPTGAPRSHVTLTNVVLSCLINLGHWTPVVCFLLETNHEPNIEFLFL